LTFKRDGNSRERTRREKDIGHQTKIRKDDQLWLVDQSCA